MQIMATLTGNPHMRQREYRQSSHVTNRIPVSLPLAKFLIGILPPANIYQYPSTGKLKPGISLTPAIHRRQKYDRHCYIRQSYACQPT